MARFHETRGDNFYTSVVWSFPASIQCFVLSCTLQHRKGIASCKKRALHIETERCRLLRRTAQRKEKKRREKEFRKCFFCSVGDRNGFVLDVNRQTHTQLAKYQRRTKEKLVKGSECFMEWCRNNTTPTREAPFSIEFLKEVSPDFCWFCGIEHNRGGE